MDINNQFDQELLSAYLDDGLTAGELAQVESWLATDPTAVSYLNSLRSNRHTLKALAGLPALGLKSSLADRVLAQTHTASQPVDIKVQRPSTVETPSGRSWWTWGAVAASAAAIAGLAILPLMQPSAEPVGFVPTVELPVTPTEPTEAGPATGDIANHTPKTGSELLHQSLPTTETPQEAPGGRSVDNARRGPEERQGMDKFAMPQLLFVSDVMMTQAAWESGKFDQLLEKYGIHYEKKLVAQPSLIKALIESQVTVGPDADPNRQQDAALVYIDSPGEAVDKLLVEIENDQEHFVGVQYKTAMSGVGKTQDDNLLGALRAHTGSSNGRGIARLIVPEDTGLLKTNLLPGFEVLKRTTSQNLRDAAAKQVAEGVNSKKGQRVTGLGSLNSESLIILRKN